MARSIKKTRPHPIALIVLEGFGIAPESEGNAITRAKTPYFDHIISHYPVAALEASGVSIGLEAQTAGGSEIGHTVIGTGRPWSNKKHFVAKSLAEGSFATEQGFVQFKSLLGNKNLHINFLLSHAAEEYSIEDLRILLEWLVSQGQERIFLHCILDGVKSSATSGQSLIKELEKMIKAFPQCQIASLIGSLYALDAKHNEGRLDKAFALLTKAEGASAEKVGTAITSNYEKKIFDEEFSPTIRSRWE
jgi:2,3-bisphosphoglycerate-independent phosphoglycerate mutase